MYKSSNSCQITFFDFNQGCGFQLDKTNERFVLADHMDWDEMEKQSGYAGRQVPEKDRPSDKAIPNGT